MKNSHKLQPNKINVLLDLYAGSSAKGQSCAHLVKTNFDITILLCNHAPSASHTYITKDNEEFVFKVLPTATGLLKDEYREDLKVYLAPSSIFEIDQLIKELEWVGLIKSNIIIPYTATILKNGDGEKEAEAMGSNHLGSTHSGQSIAYARKISRTKELSIAYDYIEELSEVATVVPFSTYQEMLVEDLKSNTALAELPQGFSLSIDYQDEPRKSTFRNITPLQFMSDIGLSQDYLGDVIANIRAYPIRVSNRFKDDKITHIIALEKDHTKTKIEVKPEDYHKVNSIAHKVMELKKPSTIELNGELVRVCDIPEYIGTSGAFPKGMVEVNWDFLGLPVEQTTLTKLPRRIAVPANDCSRISHSLFKQFIITTRPTKAIITFVNYILHHEHNLDLNETNEKTGELLEEISDDFWYELNYIQRTLLDDKIIPSNNRSAINILALQYGKTLDDFYTPNF